MMKILAVATLALAVGLGSTRMVSLQDDEAAAKAREEAAVAAEMARQAAREAANEKAREDFINNQRAQSDARLSLAESKAREAKRKENETKFASLQQSAKELMDLSAKTYKQINANGSQAISLTVYSDLERMEQLVKEMRKNVK